MKSVVPKQKLPEYGIEYGIEYVNVSNKRRIREQPQFSPLASLEACLMGLHNPAS